jgi:signal peptidase
MTTTDVTPTETAEPAAPAPSRRRRAFGLVTGAVSGIALVLVVFVALVLIVVPLALHATPFTVLTGSMAPTMPAGTLVVTRPTPVDEIRIGDVVTYQVESNKPGVVTHRVVGLGSTSEGERTFLTRGDANNVDDDPILGVQVRGVVAYSVPYLGFVNTWVGINRPGWLLKAVAGALILYGLVLLGGGVRDRIRRPRSDGVADAVEPARSAAVLAPVAPVDRVDPAGASRPARLRLGPAVAAILVGGLVIGVLVAGRRSR